MSAASSRSPLRTTTSPGRDVDAARARRRPRRRCALGPQSPWSNEEFGHDERRDQLGREHPLRLVEVAGHPARELCPGLRPPPCRAARPAASLEDLRAACGPDRRPAGRVDPDQRAVAPSDRSGTAVSRSDVRSSGVRSAPKAVSTRCDPLIECRGLLGGDGDRRVGLVRVLLRDGRARPPRAPAP